MSIAAVDWAFRQTAGASSLKFLLVAMANYADEDGCCYPSVRRLSEDTEQDRKTVLANIAKLKLANLVADTGHRIGKTQSIPIYRLKLSSSPKNGPAGDEQHKQSQKRDSQAVPKTDASSPVFPPKQSQKRDTDPSGTVIEPPKAGFEASRPAKNKDGSEVYLLNQALEIAPPSAKKELLKRKRAVLGKHFDVDMNHKAPIVQPSIQAETQPPANEETIKKAIAEVKAAVAAAPTVLPNKPVLRQMRYKRPLPPAA